MQQRGKRGIPHGLPIGGGLLARVGRTLLHVGDEGVLQRRRALPGLDVGGRALGEHPTAVHQRDAVATLGLVHEVGRDEDGHPLLAREHEELLPEAVSGDRIDPGGRLVEDQELGRMDHRHRERQTLAHAERQRLGASVDHACEVEALGKLRNARGNILRGQSIDPRMQIEVLAHAELAIEREGLGHETQAPAQRRVLRIHRPVEDPRLALGDRQETGQHPHGRGLAAAVGAEEAEDLALADRETDPIDRCEVAEAPGQALGTDGGRHVTVRGSRRHHQAPMPAAAFRGEQGNEDRLHVPLAGACAQLTHGAGGEHPAGVHRHQGIEALGLLHVGRGHQDAQIRATPSQTRAISSQKRRRERGSTPVVGSSRINSSGSWMSAQQSPSFCFIPPERCIAGRSVKGARPVAVGQLGDALRPGRLVLSEQASEEVQVLTHRKAGVEIATEALGHVGDALDHRVALAALPQVVPEHLDPTGLDLPHPGDDPEQGRLADPVGPDQAIQPSGGEARVPHRRGRSNPRRRGSARSVGRRGRRRARP